MKVIMMYPILLFIDQPKFSKLYKNVYRKKANKTNLKDSLAVYQFALWVYFIHIEVT